MRACFATILAHVDDELLNKIYRKREYGTLISCGIIIFASLLPHNATRLHAMLGIDFKSHFTFDSQQSPRDVPMTNVNLFP